MVVMKAFRQWLTKRYLHGAKEFNMHYYMTQQENLGHLEKVVIIIWLLHRRSPEVPCDIEAYTVAPHDLF